MRLRPFFTGALILWMSAPALAQEWKEFAFQEDRFTCNFPGDPKITDTTFMSQFGHRLPARVYSVELSPTHKYSGQGGGRGQDAGGAGGGRGN